MKSIDSEIKVSVCVFSFNYENYLAFALDSILGQKTDFSFEIVIGDDYSSDNTRIIALDYSKKFPDIIRLSFNEANLGGTKNWIRTINECKGKYIALLDGDDYFIDEYKLQKQFNSLENDPNAVLCFHAVIEKYEDISGIDSIVRFENKIYTLPDLLLRGWFIRTGSTFFRNGLIEKVPPNWVHNFPYRYDTILHVFLAQKGHIIYIDEPMTVWRKHSKGMSKVLLSNLIENFHKEITLAKQLNEYTNKIYNKKINNYISTHYTSVLLGMIKGRLVLKNFKLFIKAVLLANYKLFFLRIANKAFKR